MVRLCAGEATVVAAGAAIRRLTSTLRQLIHSPALPFARVESARLRPAKPMDRRGASMQLHFPRTTLLFSLLFATVASAQAPASTPTAAPDIAPFITFDAP